MTILVSTSVKNDIDNDDTTTTSNTAKKVIVLNPTDSNCDYDDFHLTVSADNSRLYDKFDVARGGGDVVDDDVYKNSNSNYVNDNSINNDSYNNKNNTNSSDIVIATTTSKTSTKAITNVDDVLIIKNTSPTVLAQQQVSSSSPPPPAAAVLVASTTNREESLSSELDSREEKMEIFGDINVVVDNNVVVSTDKVFFDISEHKQQEEKQPSIITEKTEKTETTIASSTTNCPIFTSPCLESCTISENERQAVVVDSKLLRTNYCTPTNSTPTIQVPDPHISNTDTIVESSSTTTGTTSTVPILVPIDSKSKNTTTSTNNNTTTTNKSYKCELSEKCVSSCAAYGRVCPCAARIAAHYACKSVKELLKNSTVFVLPPTCCSSTQTTESTTSTTTTTIGVQDEVDGSTTTSTTTTKTNTAATVTNPKTIGPIDLPYVNADDIIIHEKLGEGGFSSVNVCTIKNNTNSKYNKEQQQQQQNEQEQEEQYYAIKYLKKRSMCDLHTFKHGAADLAVEAVVLHTLSHPNIVQLYGVTAGSVETNVSTGKECGYFIIIDRLYGTLETKIDLWNQQEEEYYTSTSASHTSLGGGMLLNRLFSTTSHSIPSPSMSIPASSPTTTTTPPLVASIDPKQHKKDVFFYRIRIALDIAYAMEYIHSLQLVYRDLKPDNIGFTKNGTVKLFDFGLTRELKLIDKVSDGSNNYRLTGNTGSRRYMSPEVAEDKPYNQSVDVYSYCILLWELLTGEKPFKDYTAAKHMNLVVLQQERPKLDSAHTKKHNCYPWPPNLIWILKNGWSHYAVSRPSFTYIIQVLNDVLNGIHTIPTSVLTINTNGTTSTSTPNGKRSIFGSAKNNSTTGTTSPSTPQAITSNPMPLNKNSPITFRSKMSPLSKNHTRRTVSDATTTTSTSAATMKATTIPQVSSPAFLSLRKTHSFVPTSSPLSPGKSIKPLPKLSSHSSSDGTSTRARSWGLGLKRLDPHHHQQQQQQQQQHQNHVATTTSNESTETSAVQEKAYNAYEC